MSLHLPHQLCFCLLPCAEAKLLESGVITPQRIDPDERDDRGDGPGKSIRRGFNNYKKTASDDDSDFDD